MRWPLAKLEDVALQTKGAIVSGPFGSNIGSRFFVDEGVPIIRGNNLTVGERRFIDERFVYLTEAKAPEFRNCEAIAEDLVLTAAGTIGQVGSSRRTPALSGTSFLTSSFVFAVIKTK